MPNGEKIDYTQVAANAKLGEKVIELALATGLVVRRQKPGRKPEAPAKKLKAVPKAPKPKQAEAAKPAAVEEEDEDED